MTEFLATVGSVTLLAISFYFIVVVWIEIEKIIGKIERKYKIKHRFDKPPTAKCYCVDCVNWNERNGRCSHFGDRYTADCWFCWEAYPRKKVE